MLGGCEMLSRLHGTALKLLAYELLLRNYPTWRKRLTLVQVCFPYSHSPDESSEVSREIREVVARIKAEFGDAAVHYWEVGAELAKGQWTVNDRLALFSISDVLLNTAMRDGLNLLPFEYVFTKSHLGSDGVCVLSEFVGCSHVLNAIIRVNPFNLEQIVEQARDPTSSPRHSHILTPPLPHPHPAPPTCSSTPRSRWHPRSARPASTATLPSSSRTPRATWLQIAVQDMRRVQNTSDGIEVPKTLALTSFGATVQGQPLPRLSAEAVARAYRGAARRVILLGLDGTLIQQEMVIAHLKNFHDFHGLSLSPPPAALHCLRALAADPANVVWVISGRTQRDMESCLGAISGLGLAAELGFVQSAGEESGGASPGGSGAARGWVQHNAAAAAASDWRELASTVLQWYTTRTNGSYIRWQTSSAQWCYHNADPDFGRFQARRAALSLAPPPHPTPHLTPHPPPLLLRRGCSPSRSARSSTARASRSRTRRRRGWSRCASPG